MNKFKIFLQKNVRFLLIIVLVFCFGYLYFNYLYKQNVSPSPTPSLTGASYNSLTPGISTQENVQNVLGTPLKTTREQNETTIEYKSSAVLVPHTAQFSNGTLKILKEIVSSSDKKDSTSITNVYGDAPNILYQNSPNSPFRLYIYSNKGIAYLGHPDGTIIEIWYFQPTTIDQFITDYGQGYSKNEPVNNTIY